MLFNLFLHDLELGYMRREVAWHGKDTKLLNLDGVPLPHGLLEIVERVLAPPALVTGGGGQ